LDTWQTDCPLKLGVFRFAFQELDELTGTGSLRLIEGITSDATFDILLRMGAGRNILIM
jgi:hypothetical protein